MPKKRQIIDAYLAVVMESLSEKLSDADVKAGVQIFVLGMVDMFRQAEELSWADFTAISHSVFADHKLLPVVPIEDFIDHVSAVVATNDDVAKVMRIGAQSIQMFVGEQVAQSPIDLLSVPQFVEKNRASFSQFAMPDPAVSKKAEEIAMDYLSNQGRVDLTLKPKSLPPPGAYGFDPVGWITFCIIDKFLTSLGGDEFIGVNPTSGDVKMLGFIGD